jgi:uncharacterized delta-60 repeat protein
VEEGQVGFGRKVLALARYLHDGTLDPSFGDNGLVTTAADTYASISSLAIDDEDRIVVGGSMSEDVDSLGFVARYLPNGDIDTTFGQPGFPGYDFASGGLADLGAAAISTVRIAGDGKIYAGGSMVYEFDSFPPRSEMTITRLTDAGAVDTSFGDDGTARPWSSGRSQVSSFDFGRNGKITLVGSTGWSGSYPHLAATRLRSDGSLDKSFGRRGRMTMTKGKSVASGYSIAADRQGGSVIAGCSGHGPSRWATERSFLVVRLDRRGRRDHRFAQNGVKKLSFGKGFRCARSVLMAKGRVLVGGYAGTKPQSRDSEDFTLALLKRNGKLDRSFGRKGKVITDFDGKSDEIRQITITPDGGIIAAGFAHVSGKKADFAVAKYQP